MPEEKRRRQELYLVGIMHITVSAFINENGC